MSAQNPIMTNQHVSLSNEPLGSLLKRMFLVVLILLNLSGLLVLLIIFNQSLPLAVLEWAGVGALSVTAGLASRWQLRSHTHALKLLTAVLALAINLWALGWLSSGLAGFTVFKSATQDVNWRGLSQLGLGTLLAWMSLLAGRVPVRPDNRRSKRISQPAARRGAPPPQDKQTPLKLGKPDNSKKAGKSPASPKAYLRSLFSTSSGGTQNLRNRLLRIGPAARRVWLDSIDRLQAGLKGAQSGGQAARLTLQKQFSRKANKTTLRLGSHPLKVKPNPSGSKGSEIHLLEEIDYRCPFCLDVVEKNDKRGVKVCKICNTRHHTDCWDVTGTCQVPHHYK
ncbi:hypothetical protein ACFLZW_00105 [Chloroflexota bacterium]